MQISVGFNHDAVDLRFLVKLPKIYYLRILPCTFIFYLSVYPLYVLMVKHLNLFNRFLTIRRILKWLISRLFLHIIGAHIIWAIWHDSWLDINLVYSEVTHWLSFEIKPEICKVFEILFWPVHVKEHVRIIGQYRKTRSRPRNFAWVNQFWNFNTQNFAQN